MGNASLGNGCFLEPSRKTSGYRHRQGGGAGHWLLLTNEFTRWGESGDRTLKLSCSIVGTLAMGGACALRVYWGQIAATLREVGEAK